MYSPSKACRFEQAELMVGFHDRKVGVEIWYRRFPRIDAQVSLEETI